MKRTSRQRDVLFYGITRDISLNTQNLIEPFRERFSIKQINRLFIGLIIPANSVIDTRLLSLRNLEISLNTIQFSVFE